MASIEEPKVMRIRQLNDALRRTFSGGRILMTPGIMALGTDAIMAVTQKVMTFTDFSADNDPHGEHDFGAFDLTNQKIFWKIDYYDRECCNGSADPANPLVTTRVLTILLSSEY